MTKFIIVAVMLMVLVSFFVILTMTYLTKAKKLSAKQKMQKANKRFQFYYNFVLSRGTFRKIHEQIASMSVYNFMEARVVTVQFFEKAMISAGLMFIIGFIGLGDLISGIVLLMFAFVMINSTVNKRIDDVNYQMLKDISRLILSIRENYTRVRNVPDAINDSKASPLLQKNLNQIYLICTATDARSRLEAFYKECPNRILRTLATTCYIRSDTGEDSSDGQSPFKQALSLIKDEVDMEVRRQLNQRLMFGMLDKLPFVPLFLYPPIQMFYTSMISATASVFESAIGYMIKLVILVASFACYYVLSTINNPSIARVDDRMLFLVKLMSKSSIRKFAKSLVPKKFKTQLELKKKLTGCLSAKTIEYFYLEKLVYAMTLFFAGVIFSIIILFSARHAVFNGLTSSTMSITLTYTAEQEVRTREYDASVLAMDAVPPEEEMREQFEKIFPKYTDLELETQAERLTSKYKTYHNLHFKWWLAFVYIAVFFVGWNVPNMLLKLRVKMVQSESEMDVLQLQTVISILMDTPLDTLSVLYWLAKSSDIHKDALTFAYHEYVKDPVYALNHLKSKVASVDFQAMCDKLITTVYQVTLAEAFEDLISERHNTMQMREAVQMDALKSKRNLAGPVATAPMMVWMVAAFILPIAIVAVRSAISMLGQLNM